MKFVIKIEVAIVKVFKDLIVIRARTSQCEAPIKYCESSTQAVLYLLL